MSSEKQKAYMRQYAKEMRAWAKENHICPRCLRKDERTLNGMTYCAECAAIYRAYAKKRGNMKVVKVHPIRSESIILWCDDGNEEHTLVKGKNCEGSVIGFDKRQIWTVYPYKRNSNDTRYCGACERNGVYIRLMPKDFCRIFGTAPFDAQVESEDKA